MNAGASTIGGGAAAEPQGAARRDIYAHPIILGAGILLSAIFVAALFGWRAPDMFEIPRGVENVRGEDLLAFWRAGAMALSGQAASAYDPEIFLAPLPEAEAGLRFLNPPHFLLVSAPIGMLPYPVAKIAFLILSFLALILLARLIAGARRSKFPGWPGVFALLSFSPAMFASLLVLQIGPFVALLLTGALLVARRRPVLAGLLLAALTMKPQFGLMAPVFLAARGEWRAIAATLAWTAVLCLASIAAFGLEPWSAFAKSLPTIHAAHANQVHRDMVTVAQAAGKLGLSGAAPAIAQLTAIVFSGGIVFFAVRRSIAPMEGASVPNIDTTEAVGLTLLASALASPSLWVYDWPMVAAGVLLLAGAGKKLSPLAQLAGVFVWIAPLIPLGMLTHSSSLAATGFLAGALLTFAIALLGGDRSRAT